MQIVHEKFGDKTQKMYDYLSTIDQNVAVQLIKRNRWFDWKLGDEKIQIHNSMSDQCDQTDQCDHHGKSNPKTSFEKFFPHVLESSFGID